MFRETFKQFRWGWIPAGLFLLVGGLTNLKYAETLGTGEYESWVYRALAVSVTLYSVAGWDAAVKNWRQGERARAFFAAVMLAGCLWYDGAAAYGFNVREQTVSANTFNRAQKNHRDAKNDLERAEQRLETLSEAPELKLAQAKVSVLEESLPGNTCKQKRLHAEMQSQCEALRAAREASAAAEARIQMEAKVDELREKLKANPEPPPADPRQQVLGEFWAHWLPVIVIIGGATLSFFVIPPREQPSPDQASTKPQRNRAEPTSLNEQAGTTHGAREPPRPRLVYSRSDETDTLQRLRALAESPPEPLPVKIRVYRIGGDLTVQGPQRRLAAAIGVPLARLNRALRAGADRGEIDFDPSGGSTVVRFLLSAAAQA